jgi:hypothetical protein
MQNSKRNKGSGKQGFTVKFVDDEGEAMALCRARNTGSGPEVFVVADGPEDNFAVMPLREAIAAELFYRWSV